MPGAGWLPQLPQWLGSPDHGIPRLSRERETTTPPLRGCGVFHLFVCLFKMGQGGVGVRVNDGFRQRISSESGHFLWLRSYDS